MIYRIEVTQEDIDLGLPTSCRQCPVALAINRAIGVETYEGIVIDGAVVSDTLFLIRGG